ncbi:MAG: ABC transporter ATP-binding protein [Nitriliruptoraceae bacterium]|nr:ABC transporter ATP-binding protein [Nitriliruptoraceae bacterium]
MAQLELEGVTVSREGQRVLDGIDLRVDHGERLVVLGPSGAGKSTLLRTLAGLHRPQSGRIVLDGVDITQRSARDRDVAMVDQSATLQPHLDVGDNVGFPLAIRHMEEGEREQRVTAEARAFAFLGKLRRRPRTLSTGERHDVALARALVRRVGLLLLDEPFAHHDAPRTAELIRELIRTQEGYDVTLVASSNDQRIALGLAHRCVLLDRGRLVQVADTAELLARPATRWVAGFVGEPAMNLLEGRVDRAAGGVRIVAGPLRIVSFVPAITDLVGASVTVGVRPHHLVPVDPDASRPTPIALEEVVRASTFAGAVSEVHLGDDPVVRASIPGPGPAVGSLLRLAIAPANVHVFDRDGRAVSHGV